MQEISPRDYASLAPVLDEVEPNVLFARSVLSGDLDGQVWADSVASPRWLYLRHPYGMSLIAGEVDAASLPELGTLLAGDRERDEWLQIWPQGRAEALARALPGVECHIRSNFRFDAGRHEGLRAELSPPQGVSLTRMDENLFARLPVSVSPQAFWRDAAHFARAGLGFCTIRDGEPTATAFAAVLLGASLEIGIETLPAWRGQGHALWAACALIEECARRKLLPVWSCRRGNTASWRLARKLGFVPTLELPYFRIPA